MTYPIKSVTAKAIDDFMIFDVDGRIAAQFSENIEQPHRHEYHEIFWVRQGVAEHLLDGESFRVPEASLHIVPKGRIHRGIPSQQLRASCLRFNDDFLSDASYVLFGQFNELSTIPLSAEDSDIVAAYFYLLAREDAQIAPNNRTTLIHLLRAFISKIEELRLRLIEKQPLNLNRSKSLWERFNILIEKKFKNTHKVADYAQALGISSRKLNEVVSVFSGMTTSQLIDMRLIVEAKRLLLYKGLPVKEVAFELGFNEHSYFTKVFKKLNGQTPSDFIKHHTIT